MTSLRRCSVLLVALLLVAAACGGGDDDDSGGGGGGGGDGSDLASQCPIGAIDELAAAGKPVEITYWHSLPEENERLHHGAHRRRSTRRSRTCGSGS